MRYILALALLTAFPAFGDVLIAKNGANELRLYDGACVHGGTLGRLRPEWRGEFKKAQAEYNGRLLFGCWREVEEFGVYYVLLEEADGFALPVEAFKLERGI